MEYTTDILELQTKAFVLDLLADIDAGQTIHDMMAYLLREIGTFTQASHVCIYESNPAAANMECNYLWANPAETAQHTVPKTVPQDMLGRWLPALRKMQLFIVNSRDATCGSSPETYALMAQHNIQTALLIPIYVNDELLSCLGIINPDFSTFAVHEPTWLFLGRQIGLLFRREKINHRYMLFMDSIRSSNLSEFFVDCKTGHYEAFRITKLLSGLIPEEGDWDWVRRFYASIIKPEYTDELLKCTEYEFLEASLRNEKSTFYLDIEREVNRASSWFRLEFSPVSFDADGHLERFILLVKDITEQKQREEWMQYRIEHDELTSILNRAAFNRLTKLLQNTVAPFALVLLDIDKFKSINDTYGHDVGDEVLKHLASVLNMQMRTSDKLFRLGGDEFAVIMNTISKEEADYVTSTIRSVNDVITSGENGLPAFSISAGVAFSVTGYDEQLYRNADQALYRTKETTRCGCTVFENPTE